MIERDFVTLDGRWGPRQVHYRHAGSGPAVLLLHQSPQSSAEYEDLMREWSDDFTLIAPDNPGYGLSDPLGPPEASLEDFADGLAEFVEALGIRSAAAYGFHTGAGIAVALASRHPNKVSAVYANGYVVLNEQELAHMLSGYLPALIPQWDGSHLTWIWTRNRDQLLFFPWFDRRLDARMTYTLPPPEVFQRWLIEFLRAGDNYRVAYRAAFEFRGDLPLRDLQVPAIVTSTSTDVLREYLGRLEHTSESVTVRVGGTLQENLDEARDFFRRHPGSDIELARHQQPAHAGLGNRVVRYMHGQLRARLSLAGSGRPVLLMMGAARAAATLEPLVRAIATTRPVIAPDLPGHGESDAWPADIAFTDAVEHAVLAVLDDLGIDRVDAWGEWGGGSLLAECARRHPERFGRIAISGAWHFAAEERDDLLRHYAPEIEPAWHGGHLLECWHRVRNESLFWPWYRQEQNNIIHAEPRLGADDLSVRVLALLQSAAHQSRACRELIGYRLADTVRALTPNVLLGAASWDPNLRHTRALADSTPDVAFAALPDDMGDWAAALLEYFGRDA